MIFSNFFKINNPHGIIGINKRNIQLIYPNNKKANYPLADDKVKTKTILHDNKIACAETYMVITNIGDVKAKWKACNKYNSLAIKPANGLGGDGIKILKKSEAGQWMSSGKPISDEEVIYHITSIVSGVFSMNYNDSCLIEECIIAHPFFSEIYKSGVPDFRVITLKGTPVIAMLRMPTSISDGKANLHQNGVGIGVDMEAGTLTQVYDGTSYSNSHPDNPNLVFGKKIPYWTEILALSVQTAKAFPLDYLGIDVVIDKYKGPQIMEVNIRPGLGIQMVNQCGMEKAIKKYITN